MICRARQADQQLNRNNARQQTTAPYSTSTLNVVELAGEVNMPNEPDEEHEVSADHYTDGVVEDQDIEEDENEKDEENT